ALGMAGGRFAAHLAPLPAPQGSGVESVVFEVQLNVGIEARPLAKVASGGELSRLMLALKVVLAEHDAVPTLLFDEVDQGIGGEVGGRVGQALAAVARGGGGAGDARGPGAASRRATCRCSWASRARGKSPGCSAIPTWRVRCAMPRSCSEKLP